MTIAQQIHASAAKGCTLCKSIKHSLDNYPDTIIDTLIYHRIHHHMDPAVALKAYRLLTAEFVDWNEVRISPIREIQEQLSKGADSLELSVYIKELLEFVHSRHQKISLEPLSEENITEIRRHMKHIRNIEPASVDLVLMLRKEHPVFPLTPAMDRLLANHGIINEDDTRDRKEKSLFEMVGSESALAFHHLLLDHCRRDLDIRKSPFESMRTIFRQFKKEHGRVGKKKSKSAAGASSIRKAKATKSQTRKKTTRKTK